MLSCSPAVTYRWVQVNPQKRCRWRSKTGCTAAYWLDLCGCTHLWRRFHAENVIETIINISITSRLNTSTDYYWLQLPDQSSIGFSDRSLMCRGFRSYYLIKVCWKLSSWTEGDKLRCPQALFDLPASAFLHVTLPATLGYLHKCSLSKLSVKNITVFTLHLANKVMSRWYYAVMDGEDVRCVSLLKTCSCFVEEKNGIRPQQRPHCCF